MSQVPDLCAANITIKADTLLARASPQSRELKPEVGVLWNASLRIKCETVFTHGHACHRKEEPACLSSCKG